MAVRAGAGRAVVELPTDFYPAEGFSVALDALYARALALEAGARCAILSVEMTSLPPDEVDALRDILARETGAAPEACWVAVTHTFSAPHLLPGADALRKALRAAARRAAAEAAASLKEATLSLGRAECAANVNRDIETPEGWWVGNAGSGPADRALTALAFADEAGRPIAHLLHFAVQSSMFDGSVLACGGKAVSGDLAGMACAELERNHPGAVALFLVGAAGDQAPVFKAKTTNARMEETDLSDAAIPEARALARRVAQDAERAVSSAQGLDVSGIAASSAAVRVPGKRMNPNLRDLRPTRVPPYESDTERDALAGAIVLGDVALLGVKPELNCMTGMDIARRSPFPVTLVCTMVNGGAKYMADAASYDRITYEAMNSPFAKGAAELLADSAVRLLNRLRT